MYAKVFASLFEGSMRGKSDLILVFVNMLSHANQDGTVDRHWRAIIDETGLPLERVQAAISELESPDAESRIEAEEGRRIIRISEHRNWGWRITNHRLYRDIVTEADRRNYMREYMKQKRTSNVNSLLTSVNSLLTNVNTLSVSVSDSISDPKGDVRGAGPALRYTLADCQLAAGNIGMTPAMIESFFTHYAAVNFVDGAGREITSLPHALAKWKANQSNHPEKKERVKSKYE